MDHYIRSQLERFSARLLRLRIAGKYTGFPFVHPILIEPPRRALDIKEKANVTTVHRHTELLELHNTLSRNILELRQSQRIYMPGLGPIFEDENLDESVKLWLPSELSQDDRAAWCLPEIPELEFRFRYAQADDSLSEIRRLRRMLQGLRDQNAKHPSLVQRSRTRTRGVFEGFEARVRRAVRRYRHSRQAMLSLDPSQQLSPEWAKRFQVLEDADIRGPGRESYETSEGMFQPSWIWLVLQSINPALNGGPPLDEPTATTSAVPGTNSSAAEPTLTTIDDPDTADSMRVHWAKCQARADRYEEEVALTVEEMGRTLRYFEWKKAQWTSLQSEREKSTTPPPPDVQHGLRAYAHRQIYVYETLVVSFVNRWRRLLVLHGLGTEWLHRYPVANDPLSAKASRGHSKPTAPKFHLTPASNPSTQMDPPSSSSPVSPLNINPSTDPPMESDVESDSGGEYHIGDEEFDFDDD